MSCLWPWAQAILLLTISYSSVGLKLYEECVHLTYDRTKHHINVCLFAENSQINLKEVIFLMHLLL
jgi:hypothetical protein